MGEGGRGKVSRKSPVSNPDNNDYQDWEPRVCQRFCFIRGSFINLIIYSFTCLCIEQYNLYKITVVNFKVGGSLVNHIINDSLTVP